MISRFRDCLDTKASFDQQAAHVSVGDQPAEAVTVIKIRNPRDVYR